MTKKLPAKPPPLRAEGQALWDAIVGWEPNEDGEKLILRPDETVLLRNACRVADTLGDLRIIAAGLSPVISNSAGTAVISPVITEIRAQEKHQASLLRVLGVPDGADNELGGWDHLTASQRARKQAGIRWAR